MSDLVQVRSTSRRFKPLGQIVDVTRAEAEALIAEGTAELVNEAGKYTTRAQVAAEETPAKDDGVNKGRHERRDMRAKP